MNKLEKENRDDTSYTIGISMLARWKQVSVAVLLVIFSLSVTAYTGVRWTEKNLLSTDGYIELVSPLPRDPAISTALSVFATEKLFTGVDVQGRIAEALPDKAQFLAAPLTQQLRSTVQSSTQNFIQGNQFQGIWVASQRFAHDQLISRARGEQPDQPLVNATSDKTVFGLNLGSLIATARDRLGEAGRELLSERADNNPQLAEVTINLQTRFANFQRTVRIVDALYIILPTLAIASLALALALTAYRRRVVLIASLSVVVLSFLQIIGLRALRPEIINQIADQRFRPAAESVYSALVQPFNNLALTALVIAVVFTLGCWLAGPSSWAKTLRHWLRFDQVKLAWGQSVRKFRLKADRYELYIDGGLTLLVLAILAFAIEPTWTVGIAWLLGLAAVASFVHIFVTPAQSKTIVKRTNRA